MRLTELCTCRFDGHAQLKHQMANVEFIVSCMQTTCIDGSLNGRVYRSSSEILFKLISRRIRCVCCVCIVQADERVLALAFTNKTDNYQKIHLFLLHGGNCCWVAFFPHHNWSSFAICQSSCKPDNCAEWSTLRNWYAEIFLIENSLN